MNESRYLLCVCLYERALASARASALASARASASARTRVCVAVCVVAIFESTQLQLNIIFTKRNM